MRLVPSLLALACLALPLAGCDGATLTSAAGALTSTGGADGFFVTRIEADPSAVNVAPGATVRLSVETSRSAERYSWSASGGSLSASSGQSVSWTAPSAAGTYSVSVTAYAGTASAQSAYRFTVK